MIASPSPRFNSEIRIARFRGRPAVAGLGSVGCGGSIRLLAVAGGEEQGDAEGDQPCRATSAGERAKPNSEALEIDANASAPMTIRATATKLPFIGGSGDGRSPESSESGYAARAVGQTTAGAVAVALPAGRLTRRSAPRPPGGSRISDFAAGAVGDSRTMAGRGRCRGGWRGRRKKRSKTAGGLRRMPEPFHLDEAALGPCSAVAGAGGVVEGIETRLASRRAAGGRRAG